MSASSLLSRSPPERACLSAAPAQPARTAGPRLRHRSDETAIRAAITAQTDAWNRADIPAFMQAYEDSPDTTFIGLTLRKGFQPIRERYMLNYTTPEQMGKLTFNDLDIRLLPAPAAANPKSPSSPANFTSTATPKAKPRKTTASSRWSGAKARTAGRSSSTTPAKPRTSTTNWLACDAESCILSNFPLPH